MSRRQPLLIAAGVAFGLAFLYVAVRGADLAEVLHIVFNHAHWSQVPLFLGAYAAFFWLKSARWALLLRPFCPVSGATLLPVTVVGYAANVLFPMQLGEVARAYIAGRQLNSSTAPLLTSIVLERVFDLLAIAAGVGITLALLERDSELITSVLHVVAAAALLALVLLIFYVWYTKALMELARTLLAPFPQRSREWMLAQLDKGAQGVNALRQGRLLGRVALLSAAMWFVMTLCVLLALRTVEIYAGPAAAFFTLFLSVVGLALPTTPGFIGTIQLAFVLALVPFDVSRDHALAASVYYHGLITLPPLLVAAVILLAGGVRAKSG
ncbi:MAG TPA: lysylphosphatidylglycerol synthase transmembrane domain-containing protein [Steroidobacteraceae bacterium]|nr:lysylphosphatidylglycerol synthase transmembrane domain-containing protein [Steroidobacteraceae bacterium]